MATLYPSRRVTPVTIGLQAVLVLLALYGAVSLPPLIGRWGVSATGIAVLVGWLFAARLALPLFDAAPRRATAIGLAALVIGLRLAFGWLSLDRVSPGDPHAYLVIAEHLMAGQGYFITDPYMGVRTFALYPPAYPLLLTAWGMVAGLSTWSLLALGSLTDVASAIVMFQIGRRLGSEGAGRVAGYLYLIWPAILFSAPLAQKESLCTLLALLLALLWIQRSQGDARGWRGCLSLGLAAGLLALTQPGETLLAALFGLALIGQMGWRRMLGFGVPAAMIAALVMLPWWVRNWIVFGAFVPLTTAGGVSLWIGNNPDATGSWMPQPASLHGLPELIYAKRASAMAVQWIASHPIDFVRVTLAKFVRACGLGQFGLVRLAAMYPPISAMLAAMLFPLAQGTHLLLLGASATALSVRTSPGLSTVTLFVAACFAQLALLGVWFEFGERHREFATPFLILLVCFAVAEMRRRPVVRPLPTGAMPLPA